jgi:DNA-binding NarL/FixJ family response regulator
VSQDRLSVIIADDHAVVRQGIRAVLEEVEGLEVVAEAGDGLEAIELAGKHHPDVAVLILSMHDEPEYVLEAVRAGADGYVLKDMAPSELRAAVLAVHEGREYFSGRVTHQLSVGLRQELEEEQRKSRMDSLTPREVEVLLLVARGHTNRGIAEELGISPRTVETHRERVMAKLRIRSVAGLTRFVVEQGLDQASEA